MNISVFKSDRKDEVVSLVDRIRPGEGVTQVRILHDKSPSRCSYSDAVAAGRVTKTERDIEECRQAASMSFFYGFLSLAYARQIRGLRPVPFLLLKLTEVTHMKMNEKLESNKLTINYAYDKQPVKVGDILTIEHEGKQIKVKCLSHDYMWSSLWVPGGKIVYEILD